jgi:hypothetical protein
MTNAQAVSKLIQESGSKLVSVNFNKADGSARTLVFNPMDFADIKGTGKPCSNPNIFRIRDIKLGAWRSFDARRVTSIKVAGTVVTFTPEV